MQGNQHLDGVTFTLNVEIKVKSYPTISQDVRTARVLEITNVFADDLNLLYALYNDRYQPGRIDFYYKPDKAFDQSNPLLNIQSLTNVYSTILKTNLSPRTSPPVIIQGDVAQLEAEEQRNEYWEDSDKNTQNFIRLLWEALTTNNGGYYLVMDKDIPEFKNEKGATLQEWTLMVSFQAQDTIPYYFNGLRVEKNDEVFEGLKEKTHYLFLGNVRLNDALVKEYHPTMPAHAFGFALRRNRNLMGSANYQNYVPLEFSVFNDTDGLDVLNVDKVLPIMPVAKTEAVPGKEPVQVYSHVSPLVIQNQDADLKAENEQRYDGIGKDFTVGVNVRDVFGFRTSKTDEFLASGKYKHFYFDKLIPAESWPLIKFSYWLNEAAKAEELLFDVSCSYTIQEVLDLAGIGKVNGAYRYKPGEAIAEADLELLKQAIPGLLNTLYSVIAQLKDHNLQLVISYHAGQAKESIIGKLVELKTNLQEILASGTMTSEAKITPPLIFGLNPQVPENTLKQQLGFSITISRNDALTIDKAKEQFDSDGGDDKIILSDLGKDFIWEYQAVYLTSTPVHASNPKPSGNSSLAELNKQLREKTAINNTATISQYSLGVSSETSTGGKGRIVYLINEGKLSEIKPVMIRDNRFTQEECYWGIKPFSNKLWSGSYLPSAKGAPQVQVVFSNVDLDKGLKVVLAKIDQLLRADTIPADIFDADAEKSKQTKDVYEKLIAAKKAIADGKLKRLLGFVESKEDMSEPSATLVNEFRELLLSGLDKFYAYDGIVNSKIDAKSLEVLDGATALEKHRLTISLKSQKDYNLVSSKIGYSRREEKVVDDWSVLFDQKESVTGGIEFRVEPEITHIELDISIPESTSEIEHSTWIQLITPAALKDGGYSVSGWPKIKREFPGKPSILKHVAMQLYADNGVELAKWDSAKAGKWIYELELSSTYDLDTDRIDVELEIQTTQQESGFVASSNFEGFISYWSQKITEGNAFDWKQFVEDLGHELAGNVSAEFSGQNSERLRFVVKNVDGNWDKAEVKGLDPSHIKVTSDASLNTINIKISDFDAFEPDEAKRVVSVLPIVKVNRNFDIPNERFHYETDSVRPVTPATPQIRYFYPIRLERKDTAFQLLFDKIPSLPFKTTAKYLIRTAGKDEQGNDNFPKLTRNLPIIPVRQIECSAGVKPTATDALFKDFDENNGYRAFSLTVYNNQSGGENNLAAFHADTIFME